MPEELVIQWYNDARNLCIQRGQEVAPPWDELLPFNQEFIKNLYHDNAMVMNAMVLNTSYARVA